MIKIYQGFDPSGKPRRLLGQVRTKAEAKAFRNGYTKGLFDSKVSELRAKGKLK